MFINRTAMPINTKIKPGREPSYIVKDMDKAGEIALFYGFRPVKTPRIEKTDMEQAMSFVPNGSDALKSVFPRPEEKTALLRTLLELNLHNEPLPVMLHYKRPMS